MPDLHWLCLEPQTLSTRSFHGQARVRSNALPKPAVALNSPLRPTWKDEERGYVQAATPTPHRTDGVAQCIAQDLLLAVVQDKHTVHGQLLGAGQVRPGGVVGALLEGDGLAPLVSVDVGGGGAVLLRARHGVLPGRGRRDHCDAAAGEGRQGRVTNGARGLVEGFQTASRSLCPDERLDGTVPKTVYFCATSVSHTVMVLLALVIFPAFSPQGLSVASEATQNQPRDRVWWKGHTRKSRFT